MHGYYMCMLHTSGWNAASCNALMDGQYSASPSMLLVQPIYRAYSKGSRVLVFFNHFAWPRIQQTLGS